MGAGANAISMGANAISATVNSNTPIAQTNETQNAALGNVEGSTEGSKGTWDKVKSFMCQIGRAIKNSLFAAAAFVKNQGVRIGTALGIAVGVLAIVGCIVSLPVSLPLLGAIAGGLFAVGAIGKLIKNTQEAEGAANIIKKTLQDIKSDMIMGAKRALRYITSPKTVYTDIAERIKNNEKSLLGYKSNLAALRDILYNSKEQLKESSTKIEALKTQIEGFVREVIGTPTSGKPLNDSLKQERDDILKNLKELYENKSFENIETTNHISLRSILQNLIEKFGSDEFIEELGRAPTFKQENTQ